MTTKKLNIVFEEVKVAKIDINLGNLEQYKSRFLALKNHERETKEILRVRGFYDSSEVQVVLLIEDDEPEADELARCTEWAGQFGEITECNVETAWILDEKNYMDGVTSQLRYKDWYVYGKRC